MIKFIKEIFSSENLKRAMILVSLTKPNITTSDCLYLHEVIRDMDAKDIDINEEILTKKAA